LAKAGEVDMKKF